MEALDLQDTSLPHELTMGLAFLLQIFGFSMVDLLIGKDWCVHNVISDSMRSYP